MRIHEYNYGLITDIARISHVETKTASCPTKDDNIHITSTMNFLEFLSILFGWVYTICWSLSFYPQPLSNFREKSTGGTTVDYPFINIFGHSAYMVYNSAMYWSPVIRHEYARRHHGLTPTVAFNDIAFSFHAVILTAVLLTQYFMPSLWGFERAPGMVPSRMMTGVACGSVLAIIFITFLVVGDGAATDDPKAAWAWLDVIYTISYIKMVVTLVKYAPQLLYNYRNRSTKGWSIWQILLDFTGGVLSIAQLAIDSYLQHDWSGVTGNPAKLVLGNVSIIYDVMFMVQHYVVYPQRKDDPAKCGERASLLERGEDERRLE